MKDEHGIEAVLHRILDQPLEPGALVRDAAGFEIQVLLDESQTVSVA